MPRSLRELAEHVGGEVRGDGAVEVQGVRSLEHAGASDLAFVADRRHAEAAASSGAGAFLVTDGVADLGRPSLVVRDVYRALAELLPLLHPVAEPEPGVHPTAVLGPDAEIDPTASIGAYVVVGAGTRVGPSCRIEAHVVVGSGCEIGAGSRLHPGVVLYDGTIVGAGVILQAGVVVGSDGYGYATDGDGHHKLTHVGRAVLEDEVEIGANSTVDRSLLEETRLGAGTKVDNLVMVAHNVRIGERCLLVAQSGVAGSARLGDRVIVAAQSGIIGHVEIGDDVVVATKSALLRGAAAGERVAGIPARDMADWKRQAALLGKLPEIARRVRRLERQLAALSEDSEEE